MHDVMCGAGTDRAYLALRVHWFRRKTARRRGDAMHSAVLQVVGRKLVAKAREMEQSQGVTREGKAAYARRCAWQ